MRSLPLKAATFLIVAAAWGCGSDGSGVGPGDNPPVADFTLPTNCTTAAACTFTDKSSDDKGISSWGWDFGDGTTSADQSPSHQYGTANTYTVKLTVTDASGQTNTKAQQLVVTGGTTGNQAPTAAFTFPTTGCTVQANCQFTDASTDIDGTVAGWAWNFGDGTTSAEQSPVHQFQVAGTYTVTLTVTDNGGAQSQPVSQTVEVTGAASQDCAASGPTAVVCTLTMPSASKVNVTLTSTSCQIGGNKVEAAALATANAPRNQVLWFNVCSKPIGDVQPIKDINGAQLSLAAGAQLQIRFTRGEPDVTDPAAGQPQATVDGSGPSWTVNIEDGGNTGGAGEPDFNDVVLSVQATP
jgi:PKD repeat protein